MSSFISRLAVSFLLVPLPYVGSPPPLTLLLLSPFVASLHSAPSPALSSLALTLFLPLILHLLPHFVPSPSPSLCLHNLPLFLSLPLRSLLLTMLPPCYSAPTSFLFSLSQPSFHLLLCQMSFIRPLILSLKLSIYLTVCLTVWLAAGMSVILIFILECIILRGSRL